MQRCVQPAKCNQPPWPDFRIRALASRAFEPFNAPDQLTLRQKICSGRLMRTPYLWLGRDVRHGLHLARSFPRFKNLRKRREYYADNQ
jgi:hypothetical protein